MNKEDKQWIIHFIYHASSKLEDCVYVEDCEYCNSFEKTLLLRDKVGLE